MNSKERKFILGIVTLLDTLLDEETTDAPDEDESVVAEFMANHTCDSPGDKILFADLYQLFVNSLPASQRISSILFSRLLRKSHDVRNGTGNVLYIWGITLNGSVNQVPESQVPAETRYRRPSQKHRRSVPRN